MVIRQFFICMWPTTVPPEGPVVRGEDRSNFYIVPIRISTPSVIISTKEYFIIEGWDFYITTFVPSQILLGYRLSSLWVRSTHNSFFSYVEKIKFLLLSIGSYYYVSFLESKSCIGHFCLLQRRDVIGEI